MTDIIEPQVHVMFNGRSSDINQSVLDVGVLSSDGQIRQAVASYLDVPVAKLQTFDVDRQGNEITLRPNATFGASITG